MEPTTQLDIFMACLSACNVYHTLYNQDHIWLVDKEITPGVTVEGNRVNLITKPLFIKTTRVVRATYTDGHFYHFFDTYGKYIAGKRDGVCDKEKYLLLTGRLTYESS